MKHNPTGFLEDMNFLSAFPYLQHGIIPSPPTWKTIYSDQQSPFLDLETELLRVCYYSDHLLWLFLNKKTCVFVIT